MGNFYSSLFGEITPNSRVVHPETGEMYGGTDWSNPAKLAECEALPLIEDEGDVPENPVLTGASISLSGDELSYVKTKQWRSKTQNELDSEYAAALAAVSTRVNDTREQLLEALVVEVDGMFFEANETGRKNINGVLTALTCSIPVGETLLWRDASNISRELTQTQLVMLGGAMLLAVQQLFEKSWQIKDEVLPLLTTSELTSFDALAAFNEEISSSSSSSSS
jgi:hypothetical protein